MTHTTNPTLILGIVVLFGLGAMIHFIRRFRDRQISSSYPPFDNVQRAMHWALALGTAGAFISGLPVYLSQFLVNPPTPYRFQFLYWGLIVSAWRDIHIDLALLVVVLITVHVVRDAIHLGKMREISVTKLDFREAKMRTKNFLLISRERLTASSGFDFFQKVFHLSLIVLGAFLLNTGLIMWDAITWQGTPIFVYLDRFSHPLMDSFIRTGHLVAAMLFAGLCVLHVYFALLPQNRRSLKNVIKIRNLRVEKFYGDK